MIYDLPIQPSTLADSLHHAIKYREQSEKDQGYTIDSIGLKTMRDTLEVLKGMIE
jgi:hypothetical protein